MSRDTQRRDVREALAQALASGVHTRIQGTFLGNNLEQEGYVRALGADRVLLGCHKEDSRGLAFMLSDISLVTFLEDPERDLSPGFAPAPVDPPPKRFTPGQREALPPPEQRVDAVAHV